MTDQLTSTQLARLLANRPAESAPASIDHSLLPLFAALPRPMLDEMIQERHLSSGEILFREGDAGDAMYLVRGGSLAVFKGDAETPTILSYRGPGEAIGEMALLENRPRSATVVAATPVSLLYVSRAHFQRLLEQRPEIGLNFLRVLSARLRESDQARLQNTLDLHETSAQVSDLHVEKQRLLETQRLRQQTVGFIMHDLRTPLSTVFNALHLLKMTLPEDALNENREVMDVAFAATDQMKRLADSFLEVAKMEAGKPRLKLTEVNLAKLTDEMLQRIATFFIREVTVRGDFPADLPAIRADAEKLDRILSNLVDNALHYAPPGSQIIVDAVALPDEMQIRVTDAGPGIPLEERERIFEAYAQSASHHDARRGFGLGLAFCKLTVEAHGGRIWAEEAPGGIGSRFIFTLPLAKTNPG